jgi:hypothetical protein
MLRRKTIVYFHIATIGNYQEVVDEIFESLAKTNLINVADSINVCIVGDGKLTIPTNFNIKTNQIPDINIGEFYTLKQIETYCKNTITNDKILYIHTKGVTSNNNECINDWRKYMLYFNVIEHEQANKELDNFDTYGVDLVTEPTKHYSGNFWWANSNHIKKLPSIAEISKADAKAILTIRHNAEFWLMMRDGNNKSAHNSNINVYERHLHRYDENNYKNVCNSL